MWPLFKPKWDGVGWEREKKKNIVLINSYPTRNRVFQENSKKIQKIPKHHYGFISSQNVSGEAEKETEKKIIVAVSSYQTRNREFQENSKKNKKTKKTSLWLFFKPKRVGRGREWVKKKLSFRSVLNRPGIENSKKNSKKIQKIKKHHYGFISSQNGSREAEKEKFFFFRSDQFLPNPE